MKKIPKFNRETIYPLIPRLIALLTISFLLLPIVFSIIISFTDGPVTFPPPNFSIKWYLTLFSRREFKNSLVVSIIIGVVASVISICIGIPASMVLVRQKFRGSDILQIIFLSPLVIPVVVIGLSLLQLFVTVHIYDPLLRLLVGHVIITLPYVIRVISASFIGIDRSIEEAAMSLGADEITTFFSVTVPLLKSGIIAAIVFAFQTSFNDVAISVFLGGTNLTTLPVILLSWTYKHFDPSIAAVSGIIITSITIILIITERKLGIDKLLGAFGGIN